ncbi:major facilitator superfamily-domain-containing protein [Gongronella butleri]|nr:major facilitator superfamily-domain-containing protein [Gongronella butleri]
MGDRLQETTPLLGGKQPAATMYIDETPSPDDPERISILTSRSPSSLNSVSTQSDTVEDTSDDDIVATRLNGVSLSTILLGMFVGVTLSALDVSIVATIYTTIGTEFKRSNEIIWIGTVYMLSYTALQPLYGRISDIFGRKNAIVFAAVLFFVGSLLCGAATNLWFLVVARAIAGMGGGGINTLTSILVSDLVPLRERGTYQGYSNIAYSVGSVVGAPLGGLLTDTLSWRWCFYINLPLLCVTMYVALYKLTNFNLKEQMEAGETFDLWKRLKQVDYAGALTVVLAVVSFLLATSMGGNIVPWSHPLVVAGIVTAVVLAVLFCFVEKNWALNPLMPWSIISSRTPLACASVNFWLVMATQSTIYLIPLFFQVILGYSPTKGGLYYLPKVGAISIGSLYAGKYMSRTGEYQKLTIVGSLIALCSMIGYTCWHPESHFVFLVLPTLMDGFSLGLVLTTTLIAMLSCVGPKEMATITSMSYLFRSAGGVIGISVTSAIFQGKVKSLLAERITGPDAEKYIEIARKSMNDIRVLLPDDVLQVVLETYQLALRYAFGACIFIAAMQFISTLFIQRFELQTKIKK